MNFEVTADTCRHLGGPNNMVNAHALNLEKYLLYLSFLLRDLFHCMIFDSIFYCVTIHTLCRQKRPGYPSLKYTAQEPDEIQLQALSSWIAFFIPPSLCPPLRSVENRSLDHYITISIRRVVGPNGVIYYIRRHKRCDFNTPLYL